MSNISHADLHAEVERQVAHVKHQLERELDARVAENTAVLEKEVSAYRSTLLWFTSGIGALALGVVVTWANNRIDTTVTTEISSLEERVGGRLGELFEAQRTLAEEQIEARLNEELAISTLLPLLVAEALAMSPDESFAYTAEAADQVILGLANLREEILALEGIPRNIALRRIGAVMRAFWAAGDYDRVIELYNVFGPDLLEHPDVAATLLESGVNVVVVEGHGPHNSDFIDVLLSHRTEEPFAAQMSELLRVLVEFEMPWDAPEIRDAVLSIEAGIPGFAETSVEVILLLDAETSPGARNHSTAGRARFNQLLETLSVVAASGQN